MTRSQTPKTTADVLHRAAHLIETGSAITATGAIYLALALNQEGDYQAGQPLNANLYEQARRALAAHLGYATDRDPTRDLRNWSQLHTAAEMAREIRAAAGPTVRGGDDIGHAAHHDYLREQEDRD